MFRLSHLTVALAIFSTAQFTGCSSKESGFSGSGGGKSSKDANSKTLTAEPVSQVTATAAATSNSSNPPDASTGGSTGSSTGSTSAGSTGDSTTSTTSSSLGSGDGSKVVTDSASGALSCSLSISSVGAKASGSVLHIHQDSPIQVDMLVVGADAATLNGAAVVLDAAHKYSVKVASVAADVDYTGVATTTAGTSATCKVSVLVSGKWYKSVGENCTQLCGAIKSDLVADPQGSKCASGENFHNTLFNKHINFYPNGKWGDGYSTLNTQIVGKYCYAYPTSLQKQDNDATDIISGCYCWDRR